MPTIFTINGYRFYFYSNEGNPVEPCHIHVQKGNGLAKYWIEPRISLCDSINFSKSELKFIAKQIEENKIIIKEAWENVQLRK